MQSAIDHLMRVCFGLSAEDSRRMVDLLGPESFRFEPAPGPATSTAPAAMLAAWRADQWFGGRPVPARAIAYVGTDPLMRGQGVAGQLLTRTLREAHEAGDALAALYPATLPLYARRGFAPGGVSQRLTAPPASFGSPRPDRPMVRMTPVDVNILAGLRAREAAQTAGLMTRNETMWTLALHPDGGETADVYLASGPDGWEGYIALAPPRDDCLRVADVCLLTGRAVESAMGLLASYRSRVDRIIWPGRPDDPLLYLATEVGGDIDEWEEWRLRIVNAPAALTARGYPCNVNATLYFDIADDLFPENNGLWMLTVKNGQGNICRAKVVTNSYIRLDVSALASLYTGYIFAASLRRMGRLFGEDEAVATANALFSGPFPFMPDRF